MGPRQTDMGVFPYTCCFLRESPQTHSAVSTHSCPSDGRWYSRPGRVVPACLGFTAGESDPGDGGDPQPGTCGNRDWYLGEFS